MQRLFKQNADAQNALAFDKLRHALKSKRVLGFVGAGVSRRVGFPVWTTLLEQLHDLAVRKDYLPQDTRWLREQEDLLWRAQFYREVLGEERFNDLLTKKFRRRFKTDAFLRRLVRLPFRHFLTTNYDNVLTKTHRRVYSSAPRIIDWANEPELRKFINELSDHEARGRVYVHLHGRIVGDRLRSIVLTDSDYAERYLRSEDTRRKLFTIFATQRVAFIGFSMNDPDLQSLIRLVHASIGGDQPRHFAILALSQSDGHPNLLRKRWREKYGIDPIFYPVVKDHKALEVVIRGLSTGRRSLPKLHFQPPPLARIEPIAQAAVPIDPEDPQHGQWGGKATGNGRRLNAQILEGEKGYYRVAITLSATNQVPLTKPIRFHLHDTFDPDVYPPDKVTAKQAILEIETYGSFTVGVEADEGATRLEYDLAKIRGASRDFIEG